MTTPAPQTRSDVTGPILAPPQPTPTDSARRWLMSVLAAILAFVVAGSFGYAVYAGANVMSWLQVILPVVSGLVGGRRRILLRTGKELTGRIALESMLYEAPACHAFPKPTPNGFKRPESGGRIERALRSR
jgi:hypothetical protein